MRRIAYFALLLLTPCLAKADTALLINFETVPVEPTGPSTFSTPQTVTVTGVATITGGQILGNETNLPAQSFDTPPNVYGTIGSVGGFSSTITITFDPSFGVDEVSFPLFNGATQTESYTVTALDGVTVVGTQTLSNLASNTSGGFGIIDLLSPTITSVTITPTTLNATCCNGWDYSIDSIALNESVQQAESPEPPSIELFVLGAASMAAFWRKRGFLLRS